MATRRPFWKWRHWKSIGFCLWPPSPCIWNLKLKFQSKLDLCSGNHVVYRQTDRQMDGRTRWIQYTPPPTSLGSQKIQYGCLAAILILTLLKINRLLHIYISIVLLKFGVDIQSQSIQLESGSQKIQYGRQAAILKVTSLKINRLLPMATINMHMKFKIEIPKQTSLTLRKPCHLQSPETETSNMAARRTFWKWYCWKSIGSYPYT